MILSQQGCWIIQFFKQPRTNTAALLKLFLHIDLDLNAIFMLNLKALLKQAYLHVSLLNNS